MQGQRHPDLTNCTDPSARLFKNRITSLRNSMVEPGSPTISTVLRLQKKACGFQPVTKISHNFGQMPALIDTGASNNFLMQDYFDTYLAPYVDVDNHDLIHHSFNFAGLNMQKVNISKYIELDVQIAGIQLNNIPFLVIANNTCKNGYQTSPAILGNNILESLLTATIQKYGQEPFLTSNCPNEMPYYLFGILLFTFYKNRMELTPEEIRPVDPGSPLPKSKHARPIKNPFPVTQPTIPTCRQLPRRILFVGSEYGTAYLPPKTGVPFAVKLPRKISGQFAIHEIEDHNLPPGVTIMESSAKVKKGGKIKVILLNNTDKDIFFYGKIAAAGLFEGEILNDSTDLNFEVDSNTGDITVTASRGDALTSAIKDVCDHTSAKSLREQSIFLGAQVKTVYPGKDVSFLEEDNDLAETSRNLSRAFKDGLSTLPGDREIPKFGPDPDYDNFDFAKEVARLPMPLPMGDVELSVEQQKAWLRLIYENKNVFSLHDGDLGSCSEIEHEINTLDDKPICLAHRNINPKIQTEVRKCLDTWLKQGVIHPSKSSYASQAVIVRKKTGEIRICVDYRKLNDMTVKDAFPLPRIEDALQAVQNAKIFSSIDLAQGYLQLAVKKEHQQKTAFRCGSQGFFEFSKMPFGLCNAPASFCRMMELCLGDQQYVTMLLYLDDICIFSETVQQMLDRIKLCFNRLQSFNLKIKPKKCLWFTKEVVYLGHVLSGAGIGPDPGKIDKVVNWPKPKDELDVQKFLGLVSYYRRFIPDYAKIAHPLQQLVTPDACKKKKDRSLAAIRKKHFPWTPEAQKAFVELKTALTSPPLLTYPDFTKPFILETDASLEGLGAVLTQIHDDNKRHVIAYASRTLRNSEKSMKNYSSAKLELLALKWAICEKFKQYLTGNKFIVYTDNTPITHIQSKNSKLAAAQAKWVQDLQAFDFDLVYKKGNHNIPADALSRRGLGENSPPPSSHSSSSSENFEMIASQVLQEELSTQNMPGLPLSSNLQDKLESSVAEVHYLDHETSNQNALPVSPLSHYSAQCSHETDDSDLIHVDCTTPVTSMFTPIVMREAQLDDNNLAIVMRYVENNSYPDNATLKNLKNTECKIYFREYSKLHLRHGVLHRMNLPGNVEVPQLILPPTFRLQILKMLHDDMGHQSFQRTFELVKERFYWPNYSTDIYNYVSKCSRCQISKGHYSDLKCKHGALISTRPLEHLYIDFLTLDKSSSGYENVLVMTDGFTKFTQAIVTKNQTAAVVVKALIENWFFRFGIPERIRSDQGKSFDNTIMQALCKIFNIDYNTTVPYNPRGNSICERFNRTLINLLITLEDEKKKNWPKFVQGLVFAYNATPHTVTGYQPYHLMFGRKAQTPCDAWLGLAQYKDNIPKTKCKWLDEHLHVLKFANEQAQQRILSQSKKHQNRQGGKDLLIPVDTVVRLRDHPEGRHKIANRFKSDPFYVVSNPHFNIYAIKPLFNPKAKIKKVHRRQLFDTNILKDDFVNNSPSPLVEPDDPVVPFNIEKPPPLTPHAKRKRKTREVSPLASPLSNSPSHLVNRRITRSMAKTLPNNPNVVAVTWPEHEISQHAVKSANIDSFTSPQGSVKSIEEVFTFNDSEVNSYLTSTYL